MKRFFFSMALLTALLSTVSAQSYRPLLKDGKVWNIRYYVAHQNNTIAWTLYIDGDSIVDGERWWRLRSSWNGDIGEGAALLQEEGGKVWERRWLNHPTRIGKYLLYDFSLAVGDSVTVHSCDDMTIVHIDTVEAGGGLFRRFTLGKDTYDPYNTLSQGSFFWIEGVGSGSGLLVPRYSPGGDVSITLESCYEDGVCIFRADDFNAPAWTGNTAGMERPGISQQDTGMTYDLQGRRAGKGSGRAGTKATGRRAVPGNGPGRAGTGPAPTRRGVYIKDGRKVVVR